MKVMENVEKKSTETSLKIGLFDSGIGGFSVLAELLDAKPSADFFYFSDDAHAPYGPKSDEYITERSFLITNELIKQGVSLIVVACNTATAASIDSLRAKFPNMIFVGVEPYLNAYYKISNIGKMAVLTTESTGKSERFKRLRERLDPENHIDHFSLKFLAKNVEHFYQDPSFESEFDKLLDGELEGLKNQGYTHVILGCTHYPLVRYKIERILKLKAISPDRHVAQRVVELTKEIPQNEKNTFNNFHFYSSSNHQWVFQKRNEFLGPFLKNKDHYVED
jgi:glutamate racemase